MVGRSYLYLISRYVRVQDDKKRIKTESGVYISATYKTNRYSKWKERSKLAQQQEQQQDDDQDQVRLTPSNIFRGRTPPQAPDKFNPKVEVQTCGITQMLYETKQIETMTFGKSVIGLFSKIEPKTSKKDMKKGLKTGKNGSKFFLGCHIC